RPGAHPGLWADPDAGRRGDRRAGPGQHLAALPQLAGDGALVRERQLLVAVAGAAVRPGRVGAAVAHDRTRRPRFAAVPVVAAAVRAGLRRPGAGHVAVPRSADLHPVAGGRAALLAGLRPGRAGRVAAAGAGLHRLVLPRVPRQGRRRRRIPLTHHAATTAGAHGLYRPAHTLAVPPDHGAPPWPCPITRSRRSSASSSPSPARPRAWSRARTMARTATSAAASWKASAPWSPAATAASAPRWRSPTRARARTWPSPSSPASATMRSTCR